MHAVEAIADVRSHPHSRFNPQFSLKRLRAALEDAGVAYLFLGRELGARSDDPGVYVDGKVDYGRLARTPRFEEGLARVAAPRTSARVALMCAETRPARVPPRDPRVPRARRARLRCAATFARTDGSRAARSSKRACSTRLEATKEQRTAICSRSSRPIATSAIAEAYRRRGRQIAFSVRTARYAARVDAPRSLSPRVAQARRLACTRRARSLTYLEAQG